MLTTPGKTSICLHHFSKDNKAQDNSPWQTDITCSQGKIANPSILFQLQQCLELSHVLCRVLTTT